MKENNGTFCARTAHIMAGGRKVDVLCYLHKSDHPEEWHRDGIYGDWDETEEVE